MIRIFVLEKDAGCTKKAGISALSEYSLLSDNPYPTYAVTKKEITDLGIKAAKQVKLTDDVGCVILEILKEKKMNISVIGLGYVGCVMYH